MTRRVLKAELNGERMTVSEAVRRMVTRGCSNAQIIRDLEPHSTRKSLEVAISRERKKQGGPLKDVDAQTQRIFEQEAASRGTSSLWLMTRALRIIAADNLFEAVIGDELPPRKEAR